MRLQAALEYLTTYGWAVLIIAIALAVIASSGIFTSGTHLEQCVLESGFSCQSYSLSTNGMLEVTVAQSTSDPINVTAVGCNSEGTVTDMQAPYNPPSNQVFMPVGSEYTFSVQCYDNGTAVSGSTGRLFTGSVLLNYTDEISGLPGLALGKLSLRFT